MSHSLDMNNESTGLSLSVFAALTSLCCILHFSINMPKLEIYSLVWLLATATFLAAFCVLYRPTLGGLLLLISLQIAHVVVDAPYNADHWLLQFLVHLVVITSAVALWWRDGIIRPNSLFSHFAPAARVIFLICYGYSALAKFNSHFLFLKESCARDLLQLHIQAQPFLRYIAVPDLAPWLTLACETAVFVLLIWRKTRRMGILIGLLFHALLIVSPAVAVFDFTMVIYTMMYLFVPSGFDEQLRERWRHYNAAVPHICKPLVKYRGVFLGAMASAVMAVSISGHSLQQGNTELMNVRLLMIARWIVAVTIIVVITRQSVHCLYRSYPGLKVRFLPHHPLHILVILIAVTNGLCPYIGLKTQGSFTMFSNLRTEAGHWNHLFVPPKMKIFDGFQDELVDVVASSSDRLQEAYVDKNCLTPLFEIRRVVMQDPNVALTVIRDGREVSIETAGDDAVFGQPLKWWQAKLMIFRPVTPDGSPYCGN